MPICRLAILALLFLVPTAALTQEPDLIDCEFAPPLERPEARPVTVCIINGKARNLVKPQFPAMVRAVGLSGVVAVQVMIDPRGCVAEASAVKSWF